VLFDFHDDICVLPLSISCVVQEECKSLEEFSGIPIAKLKANDPSITELDFSSRGFGDAEAYVLGMVLQVRHKIRAAHIVSPNGS
jgi:hypothetical protein